ncbi:MAG: enoyl-CoA hydratase/isomerase family protein [Deltaproteobacteria bacterium]|nr:enoyl-CoA hydratase/isomerase family protein [Deltaproteobacteria bacterium]
MANFENILVEKQAPVATVTLNRPKVLNALNRKTMDELECAFFELRDDDSIKVVLFTGAGEKAFIAGADINELTTYGPADGTRFAHKGQAVLALIENLGKPVIAVINGFALGGGCEIAMACHLRLASSKARLGQPEINLGVIPGFGGTQRLARLVGEARAMELCLTGDFITADEAFAMGLVNKVFAPEELMDGAKAMADKIASKGALTVRYCMEAVHRGLQGSLTEGLNLEANLFGLCCATEDKVEGTQAFLAKRKPEFKNK